MGRNHLLNIPNALSVYRIAVLPFLLWNIAQENLQTFVLLLTISFITDILDGFIARRWNQQTKLGSRLDSIADMGTYLAALAGVVIFKPQFTEKYSVELLILIVLYLLPLLISLLKFGKIPGLHLYSSKVTAYLQAIFIIILLLQNSNALFFYLILIVSYLSYLEEIIVILILPEPRANAKSIFSVMNNKFD